MTYHSRVSEHVEKLIFDINRDQRLRVWSIIITLFGDCIVPRGGEITLVSLQKVFSLFGIEANALRTALSRLTKDGWLSRERHGRNSTYLLTSEGSEHFRSATGRIYQAKPFNWNGEFELILQTSEDRRLREQQQRQLTSKGFGSPVSGVFIRPAGSLPAISESETLLNMDAKLPERASHSELIAASWPLEELNHSYKRLEERFLSLHAAIQGKEELTPQDSLVYRVLLIHEWRRVLLKDVDLPANYKPSDWRGETARALVGELYHALYPQSERLLDELEARPGTVLPPQTKAQERRFN